jgi:DNA-binding CsgD family transcriptional regulator
MSTRGLPETPLIEHYERDLDAVLTALSKEDLILYAPVLSAHVTVAYAVKKPERLRALILFQPNLDDPLEGGRFMGDLAMESWDNFLKMPAYNFYRLDPPERALAILKESRLQEDFLKHMRLAPTSLRPLLPSIRTPTLVIAVSGAYGPRFSGDEEGRRVASLIPGASLVVLQPGTIDYAPVIADFVAGTPERSSTGAAGTPAQSTDSDLSAREQEVLRLIAAGRSNPQIAEALVISLNTVQRHVSNILAKTGAANRTEAAVYARDRGLA